MTESAFTRKLLRALRSHTVLKDAVIFKHADRFSAGIPDFSVTVNGRTTWWEVKVNPNQPTKLQSYFLTKLGSSAFLIKVGKDGKWVQVFNAPYGWVDNFDNMVNHIARKCVHA